MSRRRTVRPRCDLAGLLLNAHQLTGLASDVAAVLKQDSHSGALRALTERRTDFAFVETMADGLVEAGFAAADAWDAVAATVNTPSMVLRRDHPDGGSDILQAVAVDHRAAEQRRSVVVATAYVTDGKPPEVRDPRAFVLPPDLNDVAGIRLVTARLEEWRRAYRFGAGGNQIDHRHHTWVWLGDPVVSGYREVPPNWEEQVRSVGGVLGLKTLIARTPAHAKKAQVLEERIHLSVMMNGLGSTWDQLPEKWTSEQLGRPGGPFSELLADVRAFLIDDLLIRLDERRTTSRVIKPGEVVYHRKISPQPKGYDRFDDGRSEPCQHGADAFEKWNGDKSRKGMAKVYSNFTPDMLYHCSRYPNCHVYSVRG